jgi:hypothetical protein
VVLLAAGTRRLYARTKKKRDMVTWRQLVDQANENRRPTSLFYVKVSKKVDVEITGYFF